MRRCVKVVVAASMLVLPALSMAGVAGASGVAGADPWSQVSSRVASRPGMPVKMFSSDSFWYRRLPADAPVDSASGSKMVALAKNAGTNDGRHVAVMNTEAYSPTLYVATNTDPVPTWSWDNYWHDAPSRWTEHLSQLKDVHVPVNAIPAYGSDEEMTVYNKDTDTYTDLWHVVKDPKNPNHYTIGGVGTIRGARSSEGVMAWNHTVTASGMAMQPGVIKASELAGGRIDHVIGIALPAGSIAAGAVGKAVATDGGSADPSTTGIQEGQYLRLPANLNIDAMPLSATQKTVARAMCDYGAIVWDRGGNVSFRAENPRSIGTNPYLGANGLYGGMGWWNVLQGDSGTGQSDFPWDKVQVIKAGYVSPSSASTTQSLSQTHDANGFTVRANAMRTGDHLELWWTQDGEKKHASTTSGAYYSGATTTWNFAWVELQDRDNHVVSQISFSR